MGPLIRDIALREIKKKKCFTSSPCIYLHITLDLSLQTKKDILMNKPTCMHPGVHIQMNSWKKQLFFFYT